MGDFYRNHIIDILYLNELFVFLQQNSLQNYCNRKEIMVSYVYVYKTSRIDPLFLKSLRNSTGVRQEYYMDMNPRLGQLPKAGGLYDVFQKALKMEAQGKKVVHMEIGKPDFPSPQKAIDAVKMALDQGFVHYTEMVGIPALRKAIAEKELKFNHLVVDPETEIVVTAGACEALITILLTYFKEGDQLIVPSPYFSAYKEMCAISGVEIVEVPLSMEENFILPMERIRAAITDRTRGILINTPSNPTGMIVDKETLLQISSLAEEFDLLVISDETYDRFLFEGEHLSLYGLPGMKERTFLVNSASKTFSMTGWRIGYIIGKAEYMPLLSKVHQNLSTCATSFAQYGAAVAYSQCHDFTEDMVGEFRRRRDALVQGLSEIPGVECIVPQGAFYVFPRISGTGMTSLEFCNLMLDYGVAMVPGDAFGQDFEGYVRLCYACSLEDIDWAVRQMKKAMKENGRKE